MPTAPSATHELETSATLERKSADSVVAAMLLSFTGGCLDAFLWLNHGNVFAGAMTGNAVLCGIALLSHNGWNALHHALPILAFICGVWSAELLQRRLKHHAVTVGLTCECLGLLAASFLPVSFPDLLFNPFIAFLAAYQIASFRKVDGISYNSTFITGDLRTTVVGLYEALDPAKRKEGLRQARSVGLVILCFLAGAAAGALLAPHYANHTMWLPVAALVVVLAMVVRRSRAEEVSDTMNTA